jgi:hypothetical protein
MIIALCEWLNEKQHFHHFDGRIIFVKHDAFALSMGDLLVSGAPVSVYEKERIAYLLNGLLSRCIESRNRERQAAKWAVGFGVSAAVLAVVAGVTAFSLLSAN